MLLSIEFVYPDVLRLYPPQLDIDGKALVERIACLVETETALEDVRAESEEAREEASSLTQWQEDTRYTISEITDELCEVDDYIADTFTDALERVLNEAAVLRAKLDNIRVKLEHIRDE